MSEDLYLNLSSQERRELIAHVAQERGLAPAVIEKDYWVCQTLRVLLSRSKKVKLSGAPVDEQGVQVLTMPTSGEACGVRTILPPKRNGREEHPARPPKHLAAPSQKQNCLGYNCSCAEVSRGGRGARGGGE